MKDQRNEKGVISVSNRNVKKVQNEWKNKLLGDEGILFGYYILSLYTGTSDLGYYTISLISYVRQVLLTTPLDPESFRNA
jgi:hypothetical protein